MTPFEAWHGRKPSVHYFRTFGYVVHVKDMRLGQKKPLDHSRTMIFIGYEAGTKAYHAYDPVSRCVHVTRDAVFDERPHWDRRTEEKGVNSFNNSNSFTIEHLVRGHPGSAEDGSARSEPPFPQAPPSPPVSPAPAASPAVEFATLPARSTRRTMPRTRTGFARCKMCLMLAPPTTSRSRSHTSALQMSQQCLAKQSSTQAGAKPCWKKWR